MVFGAHLMFSRVGSVECRRERGMEGDNGIHQVNKYTWLVSRLTGTPQAGIDILTSQP